MASSSKVVNIDDLRRMAQRRLPRIVFDYIDGGVEDETGWRAIGGVRALAHGAAPSTDVSQRSQQTTLFGQNYASPFACLPAWQGLRRRPGADLMLAQAAAKGECAVHHVGAATTSIERGCSGAAPCVVPVGTFHVKLPLPTI